MREADFIAGLSALAQEHVDGLDAAGKAGLLAAAADRLRRGAAPPGCRLVAFVPGRRPIDEASHPWLGSSDQAALILGDGDADNAAYLLFDVEGLAGTAAELTVTLSFTGVDGSLHGGPIPGSDRRPLAPLAFAPGGGGGVATLCAADLGAADGARIVLRVAPEHDLGDADRFTFEHLFAQQLRADLRLADATGLALGGAHGTLFVCDMTRVGSLYERLIERLVGPDTTRQAAVAGVADPGRAFHPWYPVLLIGGDKAALYGRALIGDIVHKRRNLTDPGWLLRVGLYLEFLTCLGVIEAVKGDAGDLLSDAERAAFEEGELFAPIRRHINPDAWREVWNLRQIAFARAGEPRTGPVSARNLLAKRRATLAFLEVHHDDLKHAIELAGPNHHNAQETWQRVFRDAERAVLRSTPAAFPELGFLPDPVREFVLWHRQGSLGAERALRVPGPIARLFGDQDGLFASACTQYRLSMNAVAAWSKQRALMDYTGAECVPREVSLLETRIARPTQIALLQRRDGYEERLDMPVDLPPALERSLDAVRDLLADVPIFAMLNAEECHELARAARALTLGPLERLVVQGQDGSSLFVLVEGAVEVLVRREDGRDSPIDTMVRGAVVGEMSLLTGEPRSATVRAVTGATVYEIGRRQYEPLLRARPALLDELAAIVEVRLHDRDARLRAYDAERERGAIRDRIRRFVIGD